MWARRKILAKNIFVRIIPPMTFACAPISASFFPIQPKGKSSSFIEKIKEIAYSSLEELALSLSISFTVSFFATILFGPSFFITTTLLQVGMTTFFRIVKTFYPKKEEEKNTPTKLEKSCDWVIASIFSLFSTLKLQTLVHESGHAIAANLLFKDARPAIFMTGGASAHTEYTISSLSNLGLKLGKERAKAIVSLSGPLLSLSLASALLILGLFIKEKHPALSKYLTVAALADFIFHTLYSVSALFTAPENVAHDFIRIQSLGIHPLVGGLFIFTLPAIIFLSFNIFFNLRKQQQAIC